MTDIGTEIRRVRKARGMTQHELSEKASISPTTLWQAETGRTTPRLPYVERIAEALGVEAEELLFPKESALESKPDNGGTHTIRTTASHAEPFTARATVSISVEQLSAALHAVEMGLLTADDAEERLLAGVA